MAFCGDSRSSYIDVKPSTSNVLFLIQPTSCINQAVVICFDVILLLMLLLNFIKKSSSSSKTVPPRSGGYSSLQIVSAAFNGCLGSVYLGLSIWILEDKLRKSETVLPLKRWSSVMFWGFTWLLMGLIVSLRGKHLPRTPLRLLTAFAFLFAGIICALSIYGAILGNGLLLKVALDVLSFLGSILLLSCVYEMYKDEEIDKTVLYTPLNGELNSFGKTDSADKVTSFARAGFFNKISFWWLNSLMRKGRERTIQDEDIPQLSEADRATVIYIFWSN